MSVHPQLSSVSVLVGGHRHRHRRVKRHARVVAAASPDDKEPPPPKSQDGVTSVVVSKEIFSASSSSAVLSALFSLAPQRFSAIGVSMFRNGGGALRHHASIARGGRRRDSRSSSRGGGGGGGRDGGGVGVAYPPTWSLPLTLGVELLASFLTELLSTKEVNRLKGGDTRALASLGAYVRGIRGTMAVGVPPLP